MDLDDAEQWRRLSLLSDPVRRSVLSQLAVDLPLTREQVADRAGITPALAGHHLAKLAAAGLVDKRAGAATGAQGRPAATYARGPDPEVPGRRAGLLTDLLAGAGRPDLSRVRKAARAHGRAVTPTAGSRRTRVVGALRTLGFAPRSARGTIECGGCPFLARELAEPLVACDVALGLATGVADVVPDTRAERVAGVACCVRVVLDPGKQPG